MSVTLNDSLAAQRANPSIGGRAVAGFSEGRAVPPVKPFCFHCGLPCPDETFAREEKIFCCQGCLLVHDILSQNGLGHFYDLNRHPGIKVAQAPAREKYAYLDEPVLEQRLLDFTDGKISRVTFHVPAIHCVACVWLLENLFQLREGVGKSQVNYGRREVMITFNPRKLRLSELVTLLASIGYEPELKLDSLERRPQSSVRKKQWVQVGIAGFGFGNIMLMSLPSYIGLDSLSGPLFHRVFGYLSLAMALPVVVYSASDYWRSACVAVRQRMLTLDVPIALGLAALFLQSAVEITSRRGGGYLDSLAGLVFLLLCGRIFQQKTQDRLSFDRDYKSFFPLSSTRKTTEGREESVAISALRTGDRLVVRNNEMIPADARLTSGAALIDYSFVTGEGEPVGRGKGDYLYAGGRQMGPAIEVETVKPVSQSYLTSLWSHEAFSKDKSSTLNSLTNRYSRRFTRIVIAIAFGAALSWAVSGDFSRALKAFTSVLIVACPCALALAAPFTLGTAQRVLARRQIFVKGGWVLERMAQVDAVVFDKTGTLTATRAGDVTFRPAPGASLSVEERQWVGGLARQSTHPLSIQIARSLADEDSPPENFIEEPGKGVAGRVQGKEIILGSASWLERRGVAASEPAGNGTVSLLAIDRKFRGSFHFEPQLRPQTDSLLAELGGSYEVALLSGDNERERERFRKLFPEKARLHFDQSPFDKLTFIRNLQTSGRTVLMAGDGLNDAGALKQSDVGVAVVEHTGAFSPASDMILAASQVPRLSRIVLFSRAATRIVRLSFGISALYNVAGISVAAAGILSPLICAVLMPLSSASVVLFACGATTWAAKRTRLID
jgi:P-type Cu+ transporter